MSNLGSWGVSGPRFDTIEDWTGLANVRPHNTTNQTNSALRRSRSQSTSFSHTSPVPHSASTSNLHGSPVSPVAKPNFAGTGRIPSFAFSQNPYQINRASLATGIATQLSGGTSSSPAYQFAIHELPRSNNPRGSSASAVRSPMAIQIPQGSPLPLLNSPSNNNNAQQGGQVGAGAKRVTLIAQQAQHAAAVSRMSMDPGSPQASSSSYNPYLLTDSNMAQSPSAAATQQLLFKKSKNLEQRVAEYLKPPRGGASSPTKRRGGGEAGDTSKNITVNVIPNPKSPLASFNTPGGIKASPIPNVNTEDEEKEGDISAPEPVMIGDSSDSKKGRDDDEEDSKDDGKGASTPASMNLRAVLRAQKAQEAAAVEEAKKAEENKKPWTGVSWSDILSAKTFLQTQAKNKAAAAAAGVAYVEPKITSISNAINQSLALQVAQQWLTAAKRNGADGAAKKPLNIYSLTEFQRNEYKLAIQQGQWLNMYPKEEMLKKEPEMIPNDQKRISSKTRMVNLARGEVLQQSSSSSTGQSGGGALLFNTYVTCNTQYGYVRYVGRVPWGPGSWVGMELVEKHPYAHLGAWVDFYHENSAISMQMIETEGGSKDPNAGGRKRAQSAANKEAAAAAAAAAAQGSAADQMAPASGAPVQTMMINTAIPRALVMAAMIPPQKAEKSAAQIMAAKAVSATDQYQPLSNSIFPFIDVAAFVREGLINCFDMHDLDAGLIYFAPQESVKRVAQKAKIDSKTLLQHKELQTNPFADVDDLAINTPKKHEGNIDMLARYLTVSDRETLHDDRQKARAIFRWICHNIRFDPNATKASDVIGIIRHRRTTAEGFAMLYHALATAGGLQCLRIRGVEKQLNPKTDQVLRNKHCWNAIKIDGEWSFVDCVFSCGQWVVNENAGRTPIGLMSPSSFQAAQGTGPQSNMMFQQMFSDAYFCTPPSLFILEHFPTDAFGDAFNKILPQEYNNLQLLRSVVSASEFEKGLIPGRAFIEYHLRASPFVYAIDCKQPSYQIEITAPSFILFDVDLKIKSHQVDLSQCTHVQYDGENVTIYLIFPVPGEYVCKITCKPSWRELDVYDNCLTYRLTSHTGLVPLSSNKDVIIGFMQHRKVNARDSRSLFNRHFTLLHPLSGHLIPKAPFIVQVKGPDIADSVIVACNGDWQRLSSSTLSSGIKGVKLFEGTCVIQPKYELQIFYEHDKKFHLLFHYKANLTSFSNVYLTSPKSPGGANSSSSSVNVGGGVNSAVDIWHGRCSLGIEGRVFDANISLDVPACKFGRQVCTFIIHCSIQWDIALQVQEGWKNGTPLAENQVIIEELKSFRTNLMTQYKVTASLPVTASIDPVPIKKSSALDRLKAAASDAVNKHASPVMHAASFANALSDGAQKKAAEEAERKRKLENKIPYSTGPDTDDEPQASTQYVLVINARNIKQGGPMRYCLSYYFDVYRANDKPGSNSANSGLHIEVE